MSTKDDDTIPMETNKNEHEEAMCLILSPQPSFPNSLCLPAFTPALTSASVCPGAPLGYTPELRMLYVNKHSSELNWKVLLHSKNHT